MNQRDYSKLYAEQDKRKQAERTGDLIDRFILIAIGAAVLAGIAMHFATPFLRA